MGVIFGVDIGGTDIKTGMFTPDGNLVEKRSVKTDTSDFGQKIIPLVAEEIGKYMERHRMDKGEILGIGMGIPGPVDSSGYVKKCVNLHWNEFNPVTELKKFFPESYIAAGNDANVAALGEYHKGAGKGSSSMMMVTLGTGVGGGVIIDGKIIIGAHGIAGEIGHIAVNPDEEDNCNCGNKGCVDQCASATGLVRITGQLMKKSDEWSRLREYPKLTAKCICDCAKEGDLLAVRGVEKCMGALGTGLAYFSHAFDPEVYVIGGGVSLAGGFIIDAIRKGYEKHLYLIQKGADIRLARLGNDAGITGACMLAADR